MSGIRLRPVERDDLAWLADMTSDRELVGAHNWSGPVDRAALGAKMLAQFEADVVREGVVRDGEFRDGAYHDHVLYSVLRREWAAGMGGPGRGQ